MSRGLMGDGAPRARPYSQRSRWLQTQPVESPSAPALPFKPLFFSTAFTLSYRPDTVPPPTPHALCSPETTLCPLPGGERGRIFPPRFPPGCGAQLPDSTGRILSIHAERFFLFLSFKQAAIIFVTLENAPQYVHFFLESVEK